MAAKKLSQLPPFTGTTLTDTDEIPVNSGGVTYRAALSKLPGAIDTGAGDGDANYLADLFTSAVEDPSQFPPSDDSDDNYLADLFTNSVGSSTIPAPTPAPSPSGFPAGAVALGLTYRMIDEYPQVADISTDNTSDAKLYRGLWYEEEEASPGVKTHPMSMYTDEVDGLGIRMGHGVTNMKPGRPGGLNTPGLIPSVTGARAFYLEFESRCEGGDPGNNFPALWSQAVEHNGPGDDAYPEYNNVPNWLELDVDEGGFTGGMLGTAHHWSGTYPNTSSIRSYPKSSYPPLDRTVMHRFGMSYDPDAHSVRWYVDDVEADNILNAPTIVHEVGAQQHFQYIMTAQTHGNGGVYPDYKMIVRRFSVYIAPLV